MLYNRHSIWTVNRWVKFALLLGRPWKSLSWVMWHHNESLGTKAYTRKEVLAMLAPLGLESIQIQTEITAGDYLASSGFLPLQWVYRTLIRLAGWQFGWDVRDYRPRVDAEAPDLKSDRSGEVREAAAPLLTGNRLGYFHCIRATKPLA